jgi:hypothetical protein
MGMGKKHINLEIPMISWKVTNNKKIITICIKRIYEGGFEITNISRAITLLVCIILSSIFFSEAFAQEGMFSTEFKLEDVAVGDFVELSMEMNDDEMEMSGYLRGEITGTEDIINVKGTEYTVLTLTMYGKGTFSNNQGMTGDWTTSGNIYYDITTEENVKETSLMKMTMKYQGETASYTSESETIPIHRMSTLKEGTEPMIGDTWTITVNEKIISKVTTVSPDGERETSEETEIESTVTNYEYIRNDTITVPAGTFSCVVVRDVYSDDEPGEYTISYKDKDIGTVKSEDYDSYDIQIGKMEIIAYKFENLGKQGGECVIGPIDALGEEEDEKDQGLFNLGKVAGIDTFILFMLIVILLVILMIGIVAMKKRKKASPMPDGPYPQQQATEHQQPPQKQQYPCPSCGQALNYVKQYEKWYCYSCNRYQ